MTTTGRRGAVALALLTGLAACGGGGDGGPQTVFTYQTFNSTVPGDSTVRAVGFDRDSGGLVIDLENLRGTLTRDTDALDIAGLIVDANGRSGNTWSDGTTTVSPSNAAAFTGTYDFLIPVTVTRGGLSDTFLVGVATRHQDLPGGSATFSGQSAVGGVLTGGGSGASGFEAVGDLTLSADFTSGLVDVVMESLSGAGVPFDKVTLSDLAILNGAGDAIFADAAGSGIEMTSGGVVIQPLGTIDDFAATGSFFGGDGNGPAEAGGTFYAEGPDGQIFGIFVADQRN